MNILFISKNLGAINLACRLAEEGNKVKVYEREKSWRNKMKRPSLRFIDNGWEKELDWIGKKGLVVFDDVGMGKTQDELRKKGLSVFGGSDIGEILENNRQYGQKVFSTFGIETKESIDFHNINKMINFIERNPRKWVIKQNGGMDKGLNYIGQLENGGDAISVLRSYKKNLKSYELHFDLQERIEGIEIAVGRFFNGRAWVGPICINIEHKNLFNDDLGPKTNEMGNLMWYESNEKNKLFLSTLAKMKGYLHRINYRGYFDINCIVNKNGAYPLEATSRLGQPTIQLQDTIHTSPWGEFLKAVADGKKYKLQYKQGYAIIVFLGTPPYPYANRSNFNSPRGIEIFFKEKLSNEEKKNIYLEDVSICCTKNKKDKCVICSNTGYIAFVSGMGKTVKSARKNVYNLINKIVVPKMFYRTDIGLRFVQGDQKLLKKWGWI